MKKAITYLAAIALPLAFLSSSAMAQNSDKTSETTGPKRFWQSSLPGGDYVVALDRISSISKHSYIIDGNLRVTEVVIDTNGNSLARFYYIIPVSEDAGSAAGVGSSSEADTETGATITRTMAIATLQRVIRRWVISNASFARSINTVVDKKSFHYDMCPGTAKRRRQSLANGHIADDSRKRKRFLIASEKGELDGTQCLV